MASLSPRGIDWSLVCGFWIAHQSFRSVLVVADMFRRLSCLLPRQGPSSGPCPPIWCGSLHHTTSPLSLTGLRASTACFVNPSAVFSSRQSSTVRPLNVIWKGIPRRFLNITRGNVHRHPLLKRATAVEFMCVIYHKSAAPCLLDLEARCTEVLAMAETGC